MKTLLCFVLALFSLSVTAAKEEVESTNAVLPQEQELDPYESYLRQEAEAEEQELQLSRTAASNCDCSAEQGAPSGGVYIFAPERVPATSPEPKPEPLPTSYDGASYRPMWP